MKFQSSANQYKTSSAVKEALPQARRKVSYETEGGNEMRKIVNKLLMGLSVAMLFGLAGCGGGGGGDGGGTPQVQTPAGTAVSMTTFKGLFTGTATAGSQMSFTLTGSDTSGNAWTGSLSMVSDGPTTFENNSVTKSRSTFVLTRSSTGTSATNTDTSYFLAANGNFYKSINSAGETSVPSTQATIPDNSHVGDSGSLWNETSSDGTSESITWKLEADFDGKSKLTFSSTAKDASNVTIAQEDDTFYLDSNGNPFKYEAKVTANGITINLSGNRN